MTPHWHIGGIEFALFLLHLIIGMAMLRIAAAWLINRNPESRIATGLGLAIH